MCGYDGWWDTKQMTEHWCSSVRELYGFWYLSEFFRQLRNILGKITLALGARLGVNDIQYSISWG